jgi:hypothetical protein
MSASPQSIEPGDFVTYWKGSGRYEQGTDTNNQESAKRFGRVMTTPSGGKVHVQSFL